MAGINEASDFGSGISAASCSDPRLIAQPAKWKEQRRRQNPEATAVKKMAHTFEMVDIAFHALNTEEPAPAKNNGDFIPGPGSPKGRREFIWRFKGG